ncbi:MAG: alanine racemase [Oscillospiraceae bacterium]|nr:alanine racemase [Oscillospiraceae bacterium]
MQDKYRVWAEIDLDALTKNYQTAKRLAAPARVMPIIKADAYGHGAVMVAKALINADADCFGVATPEEAFQLRRNGISTDILLLEPAPAKQVYDLVKAGIILCVSDLETARRYVADAPNGVSLRVHIKVDTGMNRLGLPWDRATGQIDTITKIPGLKIEGIFTHFAMADEPEHTLTQEQYFRFASCCDALQKAGVYIPVRHCSNSAAILSRPKMMENLVRPGIMLYGYNPIPGNPEGQALFPVLTLRTSIIRCEDLENGDGVSYGHIWHAKRGSRIATIPVGYADGLNRRLSGRIQFLLHGRPVPQIGRVCMDMCVLDITGFPEAKNGDIVTVMDGKTQTSAQDHAGLLDTIPYETLCAIGRRVPRVYLQNGKIIKEICDIDNA